MVRLEAFIKKVADISEERDDQGNIVTIKAFRGVHDEHFEIYMNLVDKNKHLYEEVESINISNSKITHVGMKAIQPLFFHPYHTQRLIVIDVDLNLREMRRIVELISPQSFLQHLELSVAHSSSLPILCEALCSPTCHIQTLSIDAGEEGRPEHMNDLALTMAQVITRNTSIHTLRIKHYRLSIDEVSPIADALLQNKTIHTLELSHAHIAEPSVQLIIDALGENTSLTHLNVRGNDIRNTNMFMDLLAQNHMIEDILVSYTQPRLYFKQALSKNKQRKAIIRSNIQSLGITIPSLATRLFRQLVWETKMNTPLPEILGILSSLSKTS